MHKLFNLDDEEISYAKNRSYFILVIYDIVDNKRRVKLSKILDGYGVRVQKSSYEMQVENHEYRKLLSDLEEFYIEEELDNIIIYRGIESEVRRLGSAHTEKEAHNIYYF